MRLVSLQVTLVCIAVGVAAGPVNLTEEYFDSQIYTSGSSVFMKFQAPWCKKCAAMQDDWDSLADYFQGTEVIIADIDGTTPGGKSLRKRFGVRRYPTFKYFHPPDEMIRTYKHKKDLETLKRFGKRLKKRCTIKTLGKCTKKQKKLLRPYSDKSREELLEQIHGMEEELNSTTVKHDELVDALDTRFAEAGELQEKISELNATAEAERDDAQSEALAAAQKEYDGIMEELTPKFKESEDKESEVDDLKDEYAPKIAMLRWIISTMPPPKEEAKDEL